MNTTTKDDNKNISTSSINVKNVDGLQYLSTVKDKTVNLILTDPPYIISRDSGMNKHYNTVKKNEENKVEFVKTEDEWNTYKVSNQIEDDVNKMNYMKYGSIYGKKYCVKTDYGVWDSKFTMDMLELFVAEYYKKTSTRWNFNYVL